MLSALLIVIPIFALIFAGWVAGRLGALGPQATAEINRFVVWLALPALLFDVVANSKWTDLWQPGFIVAFGLSGLLSSGLALALCWRRRRHLADAAIEGLNAGYANVGFMGFPIALYALGPRSLVPTTIASIITMCVIFAGTIVLVEVGLQAETHRRRHVFMKVARTLVRNPMLVAPVLGAVFPLAGIGVPAPLENFLKLLGGAASPCALVAIGLFLAGRSRVKSEREHGAQAFLVGSKLLLHPALAWVFANLVFRLPTVSAEAAVLLAALPTGTGSFMLAELYQRKTEMTAQIIITSTVLSLVTISAYISLVR